MSVTLPALFVMARVEPRVQVWGGDSEIATQKRLTKNAKGDPYPADFSHLDKAMPWVRPRLGLFCLPSETP